MVEVLVIPDGAAQPPRGGRPTALEAARTPVLDRLAAEGAVARIATTPAGLPAGSETGIPTLLGAPPAVAPGRGRIDAAAYGVAVPDGMTPWRADVLDAAGRRATALQARAVADELGAGAVAVAGHRLVIVAASRPADRRVLGLRVRIWDDGPAPAGADADTTLVCALGAAAGCGRLLGAEVVTPAGATGDVDTDLRAKAAAAAAAIARGAGRVVVHVGAPDEAAHRREPDAVVEALQRIDAELLAALRDAVQRAAGRLAVCPDHGTDPVSGAHDAAPVPALVWGAGVECSGAARLTERGARAAEVTAPDWLWASAASLAGFA